MLNFITMASLQDEGKASPYSALGLSPHFSAFPASQISPAPSTCHADFDLRISPLLYHLHAVNTQLSLAPLADKRLASSHAVFE